MRAHTSHEMLCGSICLEETTFSHLTSPFGNECYCQGVNGKAIVITN